MINKNKNKISIEEFFTDYNKIIRVRSMDQIYKLLPYYAERGFIWSTNHELHEVETYISEPYQAFYVSMMDRECTKYGIVTIDMPEDIVYEFEEVILHISIDADAFENILFM